MLTVDLIKEFLYCIGILMDNIFEILKFLLEMGYFRV